MVSGTYLLFLVVGLLLALGLVSSSVRRLHGLELGIALVLPLDLASSIILVQYDTN